MLSLFLAFPGLENSFIAKVLVNLVFGSLIWGGFDVESDNDGFEALAPKNAGNFSVLDDFSDDLADVVGEDLTNVGSSCSDSGDDFTDVDDFTDTPNSVLTSGCFMADDFGDGVFSIDLSAEGSVKIGESTAGGTRYWTGVLYREIPFPKIYQRLFYK